MWKLESSKYLSNTKIDFQKEDEGRKNDFLIASEKKSLSVYAETVEEPWKVKMWKNIILLRYLKLTGRVSNSAFINYEIFVFSCLRWRKNVKKMQRAKREKIKWIEWRKKLSEDFLFLTFFNGSKSNNFMSIYYVCVLRRVVILFLLLFLPSLNTCLNALLSELFSGIKYFVCKTRSATFHLQIK